MEKKLTHFDQKGQAVMVDVSNKEPSKRIALASGKITMSELAFRAVDQQASPKGDVLGVARIAGIMALKQTAQLIPLCHPLPTEKAKIEFVLDPATRSITATCLVQTYAKTGVEMEALCGVNIALLTIYDMCKALDKSMMISDIHLVEKQGGQSGEYHFTGVQHV